MSHDREKHVVTPLPTDAAVTEALASGLPNCVVGLNGRGLVTLQLPDHCNFIVLSPDQADGLGDVLKKWAATSRGTSPTVHINCRWCHKAVRLQRSAVSRGWVCGSCSRRNDPAAQSPPV